MSVAIFKDEQTTEKALENGKMLGSFDNIFKDYWHFPGSVSLNFISETLERWSNNS